MAAFAEKMGLLDVRGFLGRRVREDSRRGWVSGGRVGARDRTAGGEDEGAIETVRRTRCRRAGGGVGAGA